MKRPLESLSARRKAAPTRNRAAVSPGWLAALRREIDRRYEHLVTPLNEYGYDPFGFDRETARIPILILTAFYRYWFRVETHGLQNMPAQGPVLIVANHGGNTYPWDASMIGAAVLLEAEPPRLVRGLGEFYLSTIPFFNEFMTRMGSVVGTPDNCRQLFDRGECAMVFPEGARGFVKPYRKAYELQRFGLGFLRLALQHRVPILPVGVVGSEEHSPGLADVKWLGRLIGAPAFPVTITLPWLGPFGYVPLPVKFVLHFGSPMFFEGEHDAEDSDIEPKVEKVKTEIRRLIRAGLEKRRSWFS